MGPYLKDVGAFGNPTSNPEKLKSHSPAAPFFVIGEIPSFGVSVKRRRGPAARK
jgi:hypothetical protein